MDMYVCATGRVSLSIREQREKLTCSHLETPPLPSFRLTLHTTLIVVNLEARGGMSRGRVQVSFSPCSHIGIPIREQSRA